MKVPNSRDSSAGTMEIQMTPMIDMVFLLIVFFVWTSGMQPVERLLPSRISAVSGAGAATSEEPLPEADFEPVVIRIQEENGKVAWSVNKQPIGALAELREVLVRLAAIKPDAPVIVHPQARIELGAVIDVYDLARVTGFEKVQFVAEGNQP